MKSTRWIAVTAWLIASPVLAQSLDSPAAPGNFNATSSARATSDQTEASSFESELEGLRQDIAAIKALREQAAEEIGQPLSNAAAAVQEQRRELLELLTKLATKRGTPKAAPKLVTESLPVPQPIPVPVRSNEAPPVETPAPAKGAAPQPATKIVDAYALGRSLFRTGKYLEAEQAFRKVPVTDDNRVMLQYLVATCLRKQSHWDQAAKAYRIVAENKTDPALRDLAIWQMENIRWHQQTESQLEQLRQLRESTGSPQAAATEASSR